MDRIDGELAQLRTQCENNIGVIQARSVGGGRNGPADPNAQLAKLLHERLIRVEDSIPTRRNNFVTSQAPATASEIDL